MADILVVDDEVGIRELLAEILGDEGHTVLLADCANRARALRDEARPDLVLLDIWMPDHDGLTVLRDWATRGQLTMPVIMMSGHATIDTAVEATRIGALDFLEKPIALQKLLRAVSSGLERGRAGPISVPVQAPVGDRKPLVLANSGAASDARHGEGLGLSGASIGHDALPLDMPLREAREVFEREYLVAQISRFGGNISRTAEFIGMERSALHRKLKSLAID